jgi:hypothetical protein
VTGALTELGKSRPLDLPVIVSEGRPNQVLVDNEVEIDRRERRLTGAKRGARLINQVTVAAAFTRV